MEKHKQKSETFRAFSSACSQDEEPGLSPDQPVSQQPVVKGKWEVNSWPGREAWGVLRRQLELTFLCLPYAAEHCKRLGLLPCTLASVWRQRSLSGYFVMKIATSNKEPYLLPRTEPQKLSDNPQVTAVVQISSGHGAPLPLHLEQQVDAFLCLGFFPKLSCTPEVSAPTLLPVVPGVYGSPSLVEWPQGYNKKRRLRQGLGMGIHPSR